MNNEKYCPVRNDIICDSATCAGIAIRRYLDCLRVPIYEQSETIRDNYYFLKGFARGSEKMKAELIEVVKSCHWYDQKLYDDCIAAMNAVEV